MPSESESGQREKRRELAYIYLYRMWWVCRARWVMIKYLLLFARFLQPSAPALSAQAPFAPAHHCHYGACGPLHLLDPLTAGLELELSRLVVVETLGLILVHWMSVQWPSFTRGRITISIPQRCRLQHQRHSHMAV